MKQLHLPYVLRHLLLLALLTACGGGEEVDITTITNETAHQAAKEVSDDADSTNKVLETQPEQTRDSLRELQDLREKTVQEELKGSPYATLDDAALDSLRQAWLDGYARNCDPAEFKRIMNAIQTDAVLKRWPNPDSAIAYHGRLMAAQKACGARGN